MAGTDEVGLPIRCGFPEIDAPGMTEVDPLMLGCQQLYGQRVGWVRCASHEPYYCSNPWAHRNPSSVKSCSSAYAHLLAQDDGLVRVKPVLERVDDWATYLSAVCD